MPYATHTISKAGTYAFLIKDFKSSNSFFISFISGVIFPVATKLYPYRLSSWLDNLTAYQHLIAFKTTGEKIEQEVYDFSYLYTDNSFPYLEIVVFLHCKSNWWGGVRCVKYVTWSRSEEHIQEIYNINNGSHQESKIRFDRNTKKLYVTPCYDGMICDIYILKFFPNTVL